MRSSLARSLPFSSFARLLLSPARSPARRLDCLAVRLAGQPRAALGHLLSEFDIWRHRAGNSFGRPRGSALWGWYFATANHLSHSLSLPFERARAARSAGRN